MALNFDLAGKVYESTEVTITAEQIAAYADASGDPNPRHQPGPDQVASLIFGVVPGWEAMGRVGSDPELGVDNPLMILHGEQEFRYHDVIRAGDKLVITPMLESVEDKGKGATFVSKTTATRPDGSPVLEALATIFVRGAGSGAERAKSTPKLAPQKTTERVNYTSQVDVDMPTAYAEASGDHNPVHLNNDVATAVGLPGVINHGLGTLSLVAGGLVEQLAGGDLAGVTGLRVRFTDMVFPGLDLETTVWESDDAGTYLFETSRPDGAIVMSGAMDIR